MKIIEIAERGSCTCMAAMHCSFSTPVAQWFKRLELGAIKKEQNGSKIAYIFEDDSAVVIDEFTEFKVVQNYTRKNPAL